MDAKEKEECACDKPEIRDSFPRGCCSLNQIIKCHGDQPFDEILKTIHFKEEI